MKLKSNYFSSGLFSQNLGGLSTGAIRRQFARQQGESDCGVACLLSVIRYFGGNQKLERLRELSGTSTQGTTLLGLVQACPSLGLSGKGLKVNLDYLKKIQAPVILPVLIDNRLNHYVVCYPNQAQQQGVGSGFLIGDPAKGLVHYTENELLNIWESGTVLQIRPAEAFVFAKTERKEKRLWLLNLIQEDYALLVIASMIGVIMALLGLSTAVFSQRLIDDILPNHLDSKLYTGLILLLFILFAKATLGYLRTWFLLRQSFLFNQRMIAKFYSSLLHLPKSFFDTRKIGELIARMNDTKRIQNNISFVVGSIVIDILVVLISAGFVFQYHLGVGFLALSSIPLYFLLAYLFNQGIIQSQQKAMESYAYNESNYVDTIQGITTIKSLGKENFFAQITQKAYENYQKRLFDLGLLSIRFNFWAELIGVVLSVSVFGFTSTLVLEQELQIGEMMALITISTSIIPAVGRLTIANLQIQEAKIAFERMYEFASIKAEALHLSKENENIELEKLEVKNLTFRFAGRKPLFQNISFSVKKGEIIALLGESGSGKSTILQILERFYEAESGEILINEMNYHQLTINTLRKKIAIVPQEIKIFNSTLLENICLDNTPEKLQEVIVFCQKYGFSSYFESFPQSYFTLIGEQGLNLSGGQKQLLALARALFHKPQLLLLDEFSSAMDKQMEKWSIDLIFSLKKEMGIILVTHQQSLAEIANEVYSLDNQKISSPVLPYNVPQN